MEKTTLRRDPARALREIDELDLEPIRFQLTHERGDFRWSAERARLAELGYRRYLKLLVKHPGVTMPPTRDADQFWHNHILDTRKYAEDCDRVFGGLLHHYPYFGVQGDDDAARHSAAADVMKELYEREFGEPLSLLGSWEREESVGEGTPWIANPEGARSASRATAPAFCS